MAKPTRWAIVYAVFVGACAMGGAKGDDQDEPMDDAAVTRMDSDTSAVVDAPKQIDASVPVNDAFVPPPDAPPNSIFCTTNSECTTAGQCCLTLGGPMGFCAPGTVILGACVPIT
jgi:hypothetical protein